MEDALKRAKVYRLRAEETRTAADGIHHQINRETLTRIADDYDLMAEQLEQRARGTRDSKKSAG
jgi:DnaJ-domain-containing protein 1